jgi:hypothetical protein
MKEAVPQSMPVEGRPFGDDTNSASPKRDFSVKNIALRVEQNGVAALDVFVGPGQAKHTCLLTWYDPIQIGVLEALEELYAKGSQNLVRRGACIHNAIDDQQAPA